MDQKTDMIVPNNYPELKGLIWNGNPERAIRPQEALSLYERYWRFIEKTNLKKPELDLIDYLKNHYGNGYLLTP